MILNTFSFPEFNFSESFLRGIKKISEMNIFQKILTALWIMGPFIYLIERDPADLWLTLISIIFVVRAIIKKEWKCFFQLWFISCLLLWVVGLISAYFGPYPKFSFLQGFVWIRFPVYALAAQCWLGRDKDIRMVMFTSIFLGMITMCLILISEIIFEPKHRLTWPYGDTVPGSYLSKVSLPVFCCLFALGITRLNGKRLKVLFLPILTLIMIFFTGERGNFLIRFFSGLLTCFLYMTKVKFFIITFSVLFLSFFYFTNLNSFNSNIFKRYTIDFINKIPIFNTDNDNQYWGAWRSGIEQGIQAPLLGMGPSSTRLHCKNLKTTNSEQIHREVYLNKFNFSLIKKFNLYMTGSELQIKYYNQNYKIVRNPYWLPGINYCGNHPHNFYIQLFAETGIIGLFLGILMFLNIILKCYRTKKNAPICPLSATIFITPLALFFPFQQMGSFYGQWGNLFLWFAIGYALCVSQTEISKNSKLNS